MSSDINNTTIIRAGITECQRTLEENLFNVLLRFVSADGRVSLGATPSNALCCPSQNPEVFSLNSVLCLTNVNPIHIAIGVQIICNFVIILQDHLPAYNVSNKKCRNRRDTFKYWYDLCIMN